MDQVVPVAIAVVMGLGILVVGRWAIRLLATPGPEEIDPEAVVEIDASFKCIVCGMRLTVTHAQGDDVAAPRHCREEMDPA